MTKTLDVYLHEKIIGHLIQNDHGDLNFSYSANWLHDKKAFSISCSLPLKEHIFTQKECQGFFQGLLPEEEQRRIIAKTLGISPRNDFSMLNKIGGECAGALTFIPSGEKFNAKEYSYHKLTEDLLPTILRELPLRPLLAGKQGVRLSLAGAQDKLAVHVKDNKIFVPLNNAPSTYILKPDFSTYKGVILNEAFCLNLAKKIGLPTADAYVKTADDIQYLLVKRYDRVYIDNKLTRLHQEDFCQALGISSNNKYQNEGGPSLKNCFDLIRRESSLPAIDLKNMLKAVIFNFLIGNCDAHGKNFSFLYTDQLRLAPLYDVISTVYYKSLSNKMAMKIGGEYEIEKIRLSHFDKLAEDVGFAKPEVHKCIFELIDKIISSLPNMETDYPIQEEVAAIIKNRCVHFKK